MAARSIMLLGTAIAIAVLLFGCGGGDGDSSTSSGAGGAEGGGALSKEEFIATANKICERDKSGVPAGFTAYLKLHEGDGSSEEVFAAMIKAVLLPVIEEDIAKLEKLEAPPADQDLIEEFLRLQQKAVTAMAKLDKLSEGPAGERYLEPASRIAKAYGFKVCAQS